MAWQLFFYQTTNGREPVREFIQKLPEDDQAKTTWTINLLKQHGMALGQPYLKQLTGVKKLWELRAERYRIFLTPLKQKNILLIHAIIKKTQKTPKKELKLAVKRLKEYL